jgi:hypothetical protein
MSRLHPSGGVLDGFHDFQANGPVRNKPELQIPEYGAGSSTLPKFLISLGETR